MMRRFKLEVVKTILTRLPHIVGIWLCLTYGFQAVKVLPLIFIWLFFGEILYGEYLGLKLRELKNNIGKWRD